MFGDVVAEVSGYISTYNLEQPTKLTFHGVQYISHRMKVFEIMIFISQLIVWPLVILFSVLFKPLIFISPELESFFNNILWSIPVLLGIRFKLFVIDTFGSVGGFLSVISFLMILLLINQFYKYLYKIYLTRLISRAKLIAVDKTDFLIDLSYSNRGDFDLFYEKLLKQYNGRK